MRNSQVLLGPLVASIAGGGLGPSARQTQGAVVGDSLYILGGRCEDTTSYLTPGAVCPDPYWRVTCGAGGTNCSSLVAEAVSFSGGPSEVEGRGRAAVATDGQRYIWTHGGLQELQFSSASGSSLDVFDVQTMTMTHLSNSQLTRHAHCLAYYGGALWGTQGFGSDLYSGGDPNTLVRNDLWKYDLNSGTWTYNVIPFDWNWFPPPLEASVCSLFGSKLYVYGGRGIGWDAVNSVATYWYSSGLAFVDLASPAPAWNGLESLHASSAYGHPADRGLAWSWVVFGGTNNVGVTAAPASDLSDAWILRPMCGTSGAPWQQASLVKAPEFIGQFGGAVGYLARGRAAVLFGGMAQEGQPYSLSSDFFVVSGPAPPPHCAAIEVTGGSIHISGGGQLTMTQ
eukprot:tig00000553_g2083.t1